MIPSVCPKFSNTRSRRIAAARSIRALRDSPPWIVLASAQRCRPSGVLGPVDAPPCVLQTRLPFIAGFLHWDRLCLLCAWHWLQQTLPPNVKNWFICKVFVDIVLHSVRGSRRTLIFITRSTSRTGGSNSHPRHQFLENYNNNYINTFLKIGVLAD